MPSPPSLLPRLVRTTVPALEPVPQNVRERLKVAPATRGAHEAGAKSIDALGMVERVPPAAPVDARFPLRVASWNAERLKYHAPSRALMASLSADIWLLSEVDIGMARSGNVHTVRASVPEGCGWVVGTEFVELGLGDDRETVWHAGLRNQAGLHGNAIASRHPLHAPAVIALDDGALWFTGAIDQNERRIGGRMAIAAAVEVDGLRVWCVSVHLESESDPRMRDNQVRRMLAGIDEIADPDAPVIIGGDFNTAAHPRGAVTFEAVRASEPLFARLEAAGYSWRGANTAAPTQRTRPDGTPPPPFRRLDWMAVRGLAPSNPATIAAAGPDGAALSDHEVVAATFTRANQVAPA